MRALVVYESMFGNTRLIAEAIAGGLARHMEVEVEEVSGAPEKIVGTDLLVVGGPTHAFGMSRASSRQSAAEMIDEPVVSPGIGIREWLDRLEQPGAGVVAACFDTRIDKPRVPGSAAVRAHKKLRKLGFSHASYPVSFFVDGTTGPVLAGEYERAHQWGDELGSLVAGRVPVAV
ncbi:MAG TPA: flavodoxin domain-containing protein [Acidimicrobiia bacterium]|jgi:hypothetical protein